MNIKVESVETEDKAIVENKTNLPKRMVEEGPETCSFVLKEASRLVSENEEEILVLPGEKVTISKADNK